MQFMTLKNVSNEGGECYFHGIPYAEFDRTGHWSVYSLFRLFEAARYSVSWSNDFIKKDIESGVYGYVIRRQTFKFSQMLHDNVSLFSRFLPKVSQKFLGVGNSSLTVQNCLFDHHSGSSEVFAENITLTVRCDIDRKRTVALPSDMKLTLSDIHRKPSDIWPSKSVFPKTLQDKPLYTMSICVPYSDTDSFNHLTHAMYGKYYTDCATNAIKAGLYRHFRDDICWYPFLELDIHYTRDVAAGETIEVRTWQGETPQRLYFETRRKGDVINSAMFVLGLDQSKKNRISKL